MDAPTRRSQFAVVCACPLLKFSKKRREKKETRRVPERAVKKPRAEEVWNQCVVLDNSRASYAKGSRSRRLRITPHIITLFVIILHYVTVVYCVTTGTIPRDSAKERTRPLVTASQDARVELLQVRIRDARRREREGRDKEGERERNELGEFLM